MTDVSWLRRALLREAAARECLLAQADAITSAVDALKNAHTLGLTLHILAFGSARPIGQHLLTSLAPLSGFASPADAPPAPPPAILLVLTPPDALPAVDAPRAAAQKSGTLTMLFTFRADAPPGWDHLVDLPGDEASLRALATVVADHLTGPPPAAPPPYDCHPSSYVDPGAEVGEGTRIWHFSHVQSGARIGARCNLGQNVNVDRGAVVGDGVKVQNNVSIYRGVTVEDDVFLGPSCVFTNVVNPRSPVSRSGEIRTTRVGRGASIGANATIVCGHDVGPWAFVGAGSVVSRDVPAYALVTGVPARVRGWMCRCGVKLPLPPSGPPAEATCGACGTGYRFDGAALWPI